MASGTPTNSRGQQPLIAGNAHGEARVKEGSALLAGHTLPEPAIVDRLDTTLVIFPGQVAQVDRYGNPIVTLE